MLTAELNKTRKIGIEIEAVLPDTSGAGRYEVQRRLADIFTANGLPSVAREYSHEPVPPGKVLCVEHDSSLVGHSDGWSGLSFHQLEIKTKPLNGFDEFLAVIPKMVKLGAFLNLQVNRSTGLHVHLDTAQEVRNPRFIRSLLNLVYRFEPVIFGLVPPSRQTCGYCQPLPDYRESWSRCRNDLGYRRLLTGWSRYTGINMTHVLSDNSRIEFRWGGGSLDADKITSWVVFLNRLVDAATIRNCQTPKEQVENNRAGLQKMLVTLGLLQNTRVGTVGKDLAPTRRYLIRRWKQLNTDQLKRRPRHNRVATVIPPG
jgi:hypothetical protein